MSGHVCVRNIPLHNLRNVHLFHHRDGLPDVKSIAYSISLLEVTWGTIADKSSVNHYCNIVTKLLSFIHSMRGQ